MLRAQKLKEAEEALRKIDLEDPCSTYLRFNVANQLGIIIMSQRRKMRNDGKTFYSCIPEAVQYFEVALEEKPDCIEAMNNLGQASLGMKKWIDAVEYFDMALAINSQLSTALFGKITCLQHLKRWEAAEASATSLIETLGDTDFRPWYIRGSAKYALQKYAEAANDITKARQIGGLPPKQILGIEKTLIKARSQQAKEVLFGQQLTEECIALCDLALGILPSINDPTCIEEKGNATFFKALALNVNEEPEKAVEVMQALVEENPDFRGARESLGQLALLMEDYSLAISSLEVALAGQKGPSRADLLYDLGVAYFKMSDLESSKSCFKRVLKDMNPDHEEAILALEVLEAITSGPPVIEGPDFIEGDFTGEKEGYTYSSKGPKGEGYYKDFREYLRKLGWSDDMIEKMMRTGGLGSNPIDIMQERIHDFSQMEVNTESGKPYEDPSDLVLAYQFLKSPGPYPEGVDPSIREQYIQDDEFQEVFGISKVEFSELGKWKQAKMKQDAELF
uniref:HP domain-containing protein n=1 Tax=Octactis speculum TaxID=3111310 RepID=A0A7S2MIU8_9STRA